MTLDKDNEVAVQTMKLLVLISKWVCMLFSSNIPIVWWLMFCVPLIPQNIWWCASSRGLQAAPPVCLLFTAPSSSHSRGAPLLKVLWLWNITTSPSTPVEMTLSFTYQYHIMITVPCFHFVSVFIKSNSRCVRISSSSIQRKQKWSRPQKSVTLAPCHRKLQIKQETFV